MFLKKGLTKTAALASCLVAFQARAAHATPWADQVITYSPGTNPTPGYTSDPGVVLGSPERYTGELTPWPGDVTMYSSAFGEDEIISLGAGGSLTVRMSEPVVDDPSNPYGVDLIIFGNTFFNVDFGNPNFPITGISPEPADVEVSSDGLTWYTLSGTADGLFPTQGYLDSGEFGFPAGTLPTDFLKPVNPALTISDFVGLTYSQAMVLYDGSGGGTPFDIASTSLSSISYVRLSVPNGANWNAEIDAFANVPEPSAGTLLMLASLVGLRRRKTASRR